MAMNRKILPLSCIDLQYPYSLDIGISISAFTFPLHVEVISVEEEEAAKTRGDTSANLVNGRRNKPKNAGEGQEGTDERVLRDCEHGGPAASASYPRLGGAYAVRA